MCELLFPPYARSLILTALFEQTFPAVIQPSEARFCFSWWLVHAWLLFLRDFKRKSQHGSVVRQEGNEIPVKSTPCWHDTDNHVIRASVWLQTARSANWAPAILEDGRKGPAPIHTLILMVRTPCALSTLCWSLRSQKSATQSALTPVAFTSADLCVPAVSTVWARFTGLCIVSPTYTCICSCVHLSLHKRTFNFPFRFRSL